MVKGEQQMSRGQQIMDWIKAQHEAGRTVYATTYLKSIKIQAKHVAAGMVRVSGDHCEVQRGRSWDSINFCKITAQ